MIENEALEKLRVDLNSLVKYDSENLINRKAWGTINFEKARHDIESVFFIAISLVELPLQYLTNDGVQKIWNSIPAVAEQLSLIDEFSLEAGDAVNNRDQICNDLQQAAGSLYTESIHFIPYLSYRKGDVAENIRILNKEVENAKATHNDAIEWCNSRRDEVHQIVSATREAAASAGVATFTAEFDREADNLQKLSNTWLCVTATLAVATIAMSILFFFWPNVPTEADKWETLRNLVSKAAIVAVLFTSTIWCSRIYRSLVHQAAVNKHRALSLKTFQAFTKATSDSYVKDAVLMAATKSIFANVPTGLVEQIGSQESGVNFVEFGKSSGEKMVEEITDD